MKQSIIITMQTEKRAQGTQNYTLARQQEKNRYEVGTAEEIQVVVLRVVTPVVEYQRFGGPWCLHLHFSIPQHYTQP
jgi:hypothetical protein